MTRPHGVSFSAREERRRTRLHRQRYRQHKHNPCPHSPRTLNSATELVGTYSKHPARKRHNRWQANLRWTEVNTDSDGFPLIVQSYTVVLEYTANGTDWFLASRHQISAKDDFDPGTADHLRVFHIAGNLAYRFKVRANAKNCQAEFSGWYSLGTPNDAPPAPNDVRILRSPHGVRLRWKVDEDAEDDDLFTADVAYFLAQLWTNPDFGPEKAFSATNAGDLFTITSHGFANGDPVMLRRNGDLDPLPDGVKAWKCYFVTNVTTHTFKLARDEDASAVVLTSNGDGIAMWGLVRSARHLHKHTHLFRIDADDFDEDTIYYGRVLSVSDHHSKSAWVPATAPLSNDDPEATPTGRRPAWIRRVFTFTISGTAAVGLYDIPERVDDDYRIRRVTGSFNGAAKGGATKFDVKINSSSFVFNDNPAKQLSIGSGQRDGSSKDLVNSTLERGDHLRIRCDSVGSTPCSKGTIQVICDRIANGATADSGGGGGEEGFTVAHTAGQLSLLGGTHGTTYP